METFTQDYFNNVSISQIHGDGNEEMLISDQIPLWARNIIRVYVCVVAVVGLSGNGLLLTVLGSQKKMSSTDIYVLGLAVSDFISLCFSCPYSFLRYSESLWKHISADWICKLQFYTQNLVFLVSLLMIAGIAVDRYFKVFKPHTPDFKQRKAAKIVCICAYSISTLVWIPFIFVVRRNPFGRCLTDGDSPIRPLVRVTFVLLIFTAIASLIITIIVYSKIASFLRRRAKVGLSQITHGLNSSEPSSNLAGTRARSTNSTNRGTEKTNGVNKIEMKFLSVLKPETERAVNSTFSSPLVAHGSQSLAVPLPCRIVQDTSSSKEDVGEINVVNRKQLRTLSLLKPDIKRGSTSTVCSRLTDNDNTSRHSNAHSSLVMVAVTIVHFLTRVLPVILFMPGIWSFVDLNTLEIYVGLSIMLGKAANPILFAAGSSVFRNRTKELFNRYM